MATYMASDTERLRAEAERSMSSAMRSVTFTVINSVRLRSSAMSGPTFGQKQTDGLELNPLPRTAPRVALAANRLNYQRKGIVTMVVFGCLASTVYAYKAAGMRKVTGADCLRNNQTGSAPAAELFSGPVTGATKSQTVRMNSDSALPTIQMDLALNPFIATPKRGDIPYNLLHELV